MNDPIVTVGWYLENQCQQTNNNEPFLWTDHELIFPSELNRFCGWAWACLLVAREKPHEEGS